MTRSDDSHIPVELDQVHRTFNGSSSAQVVLHHVSLRARQGELTLLLGPSGSGKTTLLQIAAGLLSPTAGTARLFGRDVTLHTNRELQRIRAFRIGFVFQTFRLVESLTAAQNVEMVLGFAGIGRAKARRRTASIFSQLGIDHLANRRPDRFSQGEKQRVALARALINTPALVLADEPTACLESSQGSQVISILHRYAKETDACVLVASHDLRLVDRCDRLYRLTDGVLRPVDRACRESLADG